MTRVTSRKLIFFIIYIYIYIYISLWVLMVVVVKVIALLVWLFSHCVLKVCLIFWRNVLPPTSGCLNLFSWILKWLW